LKKSISYYVTLIALLVNQLAAQDVHFSQYYFSPLSLNPANTGNYRGDYRFFGNYRTQWRELDKGFNTFSVGGDMNFFPNNINISPGIVIINDRSAYNLNVLKILPSLAAHIKFAGCKWHMGIQPGIVTKSINFYKNSFPNQLNWNTGAFDNTLPNDEPYVAQRFTFMDLNAGIGVSRKIGKFETELGLALFHLNKPRESFFDNVKNKVPVRQAYNASIGYELSRSVILRLHSMYGYTIKASDWVSGLNVEYILSSDPFFVNSVFAGFMWRDGFKRNVDAGIVTAGFNYLQYTVGFSYDITFSQLQTSVNRQGAYEIAFIYRAKSSRLTQKAIPCERY
jgi:type IX secretion system PorP/SprF family membrane protein